MVDELLMGAGFPSHGRVLASDMSFCGRTETGVRPERPGGERMRTHVDHHDAELLLRLYDLRREDKLRRAREWFGRNFRVQNAEEFDRVCPAGSEENAYVRMTLSYWDMAAAIVNRGLIEEQFFFENSGELWYAFERGKVVVALMRERQKNPHAYENLEALALKYEKWMSERAPGSIETRRQQLSAGGRPPAPAK
jgi:hypothetical protein